MSAKFIEPSHHLVDPDEAARKLIEIANAVETVQDGRICIERINGPFLEGRGTRLRRRAGAPAASDDRKLHREARERLAPVPAPIRARDLKSLSPGWRDGGTEARLGILAGSCFSHVWTGLGQFRKSAL
jgi:hypothetical protein